MSNFGFLGFAIAAALYLILSLLLATSWRGRLQGGLMLAATTVATLWAAIFAVQSEMKVVPVGAIWSIEALKNLAWCAFLIGLLSQMSRYNGNANKGYRITALLVFLASIMLIIPDKYVPAFVFLDMRYVGQVVSAIAGMMMVEQLYRNTPSEQRWGIKYLCFGLGGMFMFDFYIFSDALLFKRINSDLWYARGGIYAITVPLLAISAARNPTWSFEIFVSRRVVFHTTTLLSAGVYMLLMAFAGYYIKVYGGAWGAVLQITFFFAACLILVAMLFSGQMRARAKVFFNKHFFSYRYDYREEWLRLIQLLSGQDTNTPLFERVIWALGEIVDSSGGLLWLCSERRGCFLAANRNQAIPQIEGDHRLGSLLKFLDERQWVVIVSDVEQDPENYEGLKLPGWLTSMEGVWLIVPLIHDEHIIGFTILTSPRADTKLNWENLDLLKTAGRQAASYLALYETTQALADVKQFEGFNRLSAFVVHDLKNLIAQLSLVVRNAEKHKMNPEFIDDAMMTIENSVTKMSRLMAHLRSAAPGNKQTRVELVEITRSAVRAKSGQLPSPSLDISEEQIWIYADADRMEAIIGHVIQNAQDATPPDGSIQVTLSASYEQAVLKVTDNGCGMDTQFVRDRLFRPFDSTKGLTGMGIGAYEVREFVHGIGGQVSVESAPGKGTEFKIVIPFADS
ncbi:MAG: PEP-CTERM system histidine kinase PrsK [Gammaproteobacteria bacterium]|nr:PEP-CTERM system histidine kinase PrsK [Gammaproteobacteria bacterium]MCP5406689.1 PEP-CTERM system histidine kinase PrsK [Chromatiaceae bacterium]MCP5444417.1 PEP-CTERM system histidine kinase PrsK [Chromatiaceae bacterium]